MLKRWKVTLRLCYKHLQWKPRGNIPIGRGLGVPRWWQWIFVSNRLLPVRTDNNFRVGLILFHCPAGNIEDKRSRTPENFLSPDEASTTRLCTAGTSILVIHQARTIARTKQSTSWLPSCSRAERGSSSPWKTDLIPEVQNMVEIGKASQSKALLVKPCPRRERKCWKVESHHCE